MRLAVTLAAMLAGAAAPAHAVSETAEGFSRAMQGCWNRVTADGDLAIHMCLDGDVTGVVSIGECLTHADLTECSSKEGRYAFRDEKFWRSFDSAEDSCDVFLVPDVSVTLSSCVATGSGDPIEEAVFERAIGQ